MTAIVSCSLTLRVPDALLVAPPEALARVCDHPWELSTTKVSHAGFTHFYGSAYFSYGHEGVMEAFDLAALSARGCDWVISDEGLEGEWHPHALARVDGILFEVRTSEPNIVRLDVDARRALQRSTRDLHAELALLFARSCVLTERFGWPGPQPSDAHPDFAALVGHALEEISDTDTHLAEDPSVRFLVLENHRTPPPVLCAIARRGDDALRMKVIEHPQADDAVLAATISPPSTTTRVPGLAAEVSSHPAAGPETLRRCAELYGQSYWVARNVIEHANSTWHTVGPLPASLARQMHPELLVPPGSPRDLAEVALGLAPEFDGTVEQLRDLATEVCAHPASRRG